MLLETLDALFIFAFVAVVIFGVFDAGENLWTVTEANANTNADMRRALSEIEYTMRSGKNFVFDQCDTGVNVCYAVSFNLGSDNIAYDNTNLNTPDGGWWIRKAVNGDFGNAQFIVPAWGLEFHPNNVLNLDKSTSFVVIFYIDKVTNRGQWVSAQVIQRIALRNPNP